MHKEDIKFYMKDIARSHRWLLATLLMASIVAAVLEGLGLSFVIPLLDPGGGGQVPFPLNYITDLFSGLSFGARIRAIAVSLVVITFIKDAFVYLSQILSYRLGLVVIKYFRMLSFAQIIRVGMGYLHYEKTGELHTKIAKHTYEMGAIAHTGGTAVAKICTALLLIAMLFVVSWKLTLLALVIFSGVSLSLRKLSRTAKRFGQGVVEGDKEWSKAVMDVISGMKLIRLFNREKDFARTFERTVDFFNERTARLFQVKALMFPLIETLAVVSLAVILIAGSFFVLKDQSTDMGLVLAFVVISFRILSPAVALNQAVATISGHLPYLYEVCDFLAPRGKSFLRNGTRVISRFSDSIEYRNVSFAYTTERGMVVDNVSFTIPQGAKIGVVGHSGSGKSTLIELLLRFYDPEGGVILVDGIDLRELDVHSWRRKIGVVTQDTFLFNDTIRSNIACADPSADDEKIKEAARRAYADEFIEKLPQGYLTLVGNQGMLLSGGQRQRIAIARAILLNPDVLVFDEATSSLDAESEQIVRKAIEEVAQEKTVITISHDFSAVKDADIIVVLKNGRLVESGTHEQLLEKRNLYSRLAEIKAMGSK